MSMQPLANEVLSRFANVPRGTLVPLGNHGGFSGAHVWRVESATGNFALKAWPVDWFTPAELNWIHTLLNRAASLPWIPHVQPAVDGTTFVALGGRLWELLTWMPGQADFARAPSEVKLKTAMAAVAHLHRVWENIDSRTAVGPTIAKRLDSWQSWTHLVQSGWRPTFAPLDPYQPFAEPLWRLVQQQIDDVPPLLAAWRTRAMPLQPCVADLWHDHVLFTADRVTGIIDFGCARVDSVAVDLARLLGSMIEDDESLWERGLAAYEEVRPLSIEERALVRVLDRVAVVIIATTWLRWLYQEGRVFGDSAAVNARLQYWLRRLERRTPGHRCAHPRA